MIKQNCCDSTIIKEKISIGPSGIDLKITHSGKITLPDLKVNGVNLSEGKDYLLFPETGQIVWNTNTSGFTLDPSDNIEIAYTHECTATCKQRTKLDSKPTLNLEEIGGKLMLLRILFYSLLSVGIYYVAPLIPFWSIAVVLSGDLLFLKLLPALINKKKAAPEREYEGIISIPQNKSMQKIKYFSKSLEEAGFTLTTINETEIRFLGTKKLFKKNMYLEVLQLASTPSYPSLVNIFLNRKNKKIETSIGKITHNIRKRVEALKYTRAIKRYKTDPNIELDLLAFESREPFESDIARQIRENNPPIIPRTFEEAEVGTWVFVAPYAIEVNSKDGRMYIDPKTRISLEKRPGKEVKIKHVLDDKGLGVELDLSHLKEGYEWQRFPVDTKSLFQISSVVISEV